MPLLRSLTRARQRELALCDNESLRLNLSYVLHERSDSDAVGRVAAACRIHSRRWWQASTDPSRPATIVGNPLPTARCWITARVGVWPALSRSLAFFGAEESRIYRIDDIATDAQSASFFRASAALYLPTLPSDVVGVAVLVLRPGRRSTQIEFAGPFVWPDEADPTIRAIERLVHKYVDQWTPIRAIWDAPAEASLNGEIEQWTAPSGDRRRE